MNRITKIFWFALVVKLLVAAIVPLTSDEAYYLAWSHRLQWSYYDHPPMIAWLFWLGHPFEQILTLVRWPGTLLSHATLFIWLIILRSWLSEKQLEWWLWLALLSPLVGGSAIVITPDVPLLFFWSLSLLLFFKWLQSDSKQIAFAFGLALGLGFCSKYVMVLFPLCLVPLVLRSAGWRRHLKTSFVWILAGGLIGMAPVIYWNIMNDFASFRFQLDHGVGARHWKPNWTYEYLLVQLLVIFPPILYLAIRGIKKASPIWIILSFVPLVFFLITSYRGYVEANWPIVAYPSLFYLAILGSHGREYLLKGTLIFWSVTLLLGFVFITQHEHIKLPETKLREFFQFNKLSAEVQEVEPVYARSYQMAATLEYKLRRPVAKLMGMNRIDFYDHIEESRPTEKTFYLIVENGDRIPASVKELGYSVVEKRPLIEKFEAWRLERQ